MVAKRKKRPRDPIVLAKLIGDIATGQIKELPSQPANQDAMEFARRGGQKGGKTRAKRLTPEQRSDIARIAATARWKKST